MNDNQTKAYRNLINKHFSAVQTDTLLEHCDDCDDFDKIYNLEKKSKLFWKQFDEAEKKFLELFK